MSAILRAVSLAVCASVAVLCGCGGGGGGRGGEQQAGTCRAEPLPAGPGDATSLFPVSAGSVWRYQVTSGAAAGLPRRLRRSVSGMRQVGDRAAVVMVDRDPDDPAAVTEESLFAAEPGGVVALDVSDELPGLTGIPVVVFPVQPGPPAVVASCTQLDLGEDVDGDGKLDRCDAHVSLQVLEPEDVAVPAGRFAGAARIASRIDVTVFGSSRGSLTMTMLEETDWYAPGVGLVRSTFHPLDAPVTILELEGYEVGGASSGVSDEQVLLSRPDVTTGSSCPALAAGGGRVFAAFLASGFVPGEEAIHALTLAPGAGLVASEIALGGAPGAPAVAFDGTQFLVAAADLSSGRTIVRAQRFGIDGGPIDGSAFTIVTTDAIGGGIVDDVAVAGAEGAFLVAFTQTTFSTYEALWTVRVDRDCTVSAPVRVYEGEYLLSPSVAAGPGGWLAAWAESSFAWTSALGQNLAVRALRLDPAGAPRDVVPGGMGRPVEVSAPAVEGQQTDVRVSTDGSAWLVAWTAHRDHHDPFSQSPLTDLAAARIGADGTLLDGPSSARGFSIAGRHDGNTSGTVAFVDGTWLAALRLDQTILSPMDGIYALPLDAGARPAAGWFGADASGPPGAEVLDCPALVAPDAGPAVLVWRRTPRGSPVFAGGLALEAVRVRW